MRHACYCYCTLVLECQLYVLGSINCEQVVGIGRGLQFVREDSLCWRERMIQGLQPRSKNFIEYLWVLEVGPVGAFHCLRSIVTVVLGKRIISRTLVVSCGRNAADFK